ncbi:MAG: serine hydrolase [Pirellulaceae bacterium]
MFFKKYISQAAELFTKNRNKTGKPSRTQLAFETLQERAVLASMVIGDSTFSPQVFGDNLFDAHLSSFVGFGYAVTDPSGEVIVEGGGGDARIDIDGQLDFTSNTSMEIASVSKTISAAAIIKLLSDQEPPLPITTQIGPYFPQSWVVHDEVATLTFEDLLAHTTGFSSRWVKYADLKQAVEDGPEAEKDPVTNTYPEDYNTTNYSLLRILLPYVWFGDNRAELDNVPEPGEEIGAENDTSDAAVGPIGWLDGIGANKNSLLSYHYMEYVRTEILEPLGILDAGADHTSDTPTLLYFVGDDETPGYQTPSQHLHIGGMGWNLSANELARFMAGLGNHPEFIDHYRAMTDSGLGLSSSISSLYGEILWKGGNNFRKNNDHGGGGSAPTRVNTGVFDLPNDYQVGLLRNSNGSGFGGTANTMRTAYENAWTGVVVQGDNGDNVFELRLNPSDTDLLDLVVDDELFFSFRIDVLNSLELRGVGGADTFLIEDVPATLNLVITNGSVEFALDGSTGVIIGQGNNVGNVFDVSTNASDANLIDVDLDGTLLTTPPAAWQALDLLGLGGADTFTINDLPQNLDLGVRGGNGIDEFVIGDVIEDSVFDYIQGSLTVIGGADTDYVYIYDGSGSGSDYTIEGIKTLTEYDASVSASNFNPGKLFLIGQVEELDLYANGLANQISVTGITAAMDMDVYAADGGDDIYVSEIGAGVTVNIFGGLGDDTVTIGNGDLETVPGQVTFAGGTGSDRMMLDDIFAPEGRVFQFNSHSVSSTSSFGGVTSYTNVEDVIIHGSDYDDVFNVESLSSWTDLEMFGNQGDDIFYISGIAHDVAAVEGKVTVHGGDGQLPHGKLIEEEGDDQVYVYDEATNESGDFSLNLHSSVFRARLNKLVGDIGFLPRTTLDVIYDQIERTYLYADAGDNTITVTAAPWFNQLWIYASGGDDNIDIESTPQYAPSMRVYGEAGSDTIRVGMGLQNLGSLSNELIVDGGEGTNGEQDYLQVSDLLAGIVESYQLSAGSLSRANSGGISYAAFEHLEVDLSNADNEIYITSTAPGTSVVMHGHDGDDLLSASNLASAVTFYGNDGQDRAVLLGTPGNDTITANSNALELGAGSLNGDAETLEIDGSGGTDRLDLVGLKGVDEAFVISPSTKPNQGRVSRNPFAAISYTNVEEIFAAGNTADGDADSLQVRGQTDPSAILGGAYNDRFQIDLATAGTSADPVMRLFKGRTALLTLVDYEDLGIPTINGLLGDDVFDVLVKPNALSPSRQIHIAGGGGHDRLRIFYTDKDSKANNKPSKTTIEYLDAFFAIYHDDVEEIQLYPA